MILLLPICLLLDKASFDLNVNICRIICEGYGKFCPILGYRPLRNWKEDNFNALNKIFVKVDKAFDMKRLK